MLEKSTPYKFVYCVIMTKTIESMMTVCSYHGANVLQSESTLYGCLKIKETLAQYRGEI